MLLKERLLSLNFSGSMFFFLNWWTRSNGFFFFFFFSHFQTTTTNIVHKSMGCNVDHNLTRTWKPIFQQSAILPLLTVPFYMIVEFCGRLCHPPDWSLKGWIKFLWFPVGEWTGICYQVWLKIRQIKAGNLKTAGQFLVVESLIHAELF